jgi:hypothetical protein
VFSYHLLRRDLEDGWKFVQSFVYDEYYIWIAESLLKLTLLTEFKLPNKMCMIHLKLFVEMSSNLFTFVSCMFLLEDCRFFRIIGK